MKICNISKKMDENELKMQHNPFGRKVLMAVLNSNTRFVGFYRVSKDNVHTEERVQILIKKLECKTMKGLEGQGLALQEIIGVIIVF